MSYILRLCSSFVCNKNRVSSFFCLFLNLYIHFINNLIRTPEKQLQHHSYVQCDSLQRHRISVVPFCTLQYLCGRLITASQWLWVFVRRGRPSVSGAVSRPCPSGAGTSRPYRPAAGACFCTRPQIGRVSARPAPAFARAVTVTPACVPFHEAGRRATADLPAAMADKRLLCGVCGRKLVTGS